MRALVPQDLPPSMRRRRNASLLFKTAAAYVRARAFRITLDAAAKQLYGKDDSADVIKAASTPATLGSPAWAGAVGFDYIASELIQSITALSAAAGLMGLGLQVDLSKKASITIPSRKYDAQMGGAWVAEGQPIPVRESSVQGGPKLTPKKLAVIATFTREMAEADSIEIFCRALIGEAASVTLDTQMFSTDPGDATKPAGILVGATVVPPVSVSEPWAISSDIGNLVQALADYGGGLEPVIIAAPSQAASLRMWRQESFYAVLPSLALAPGTVVAVEASSFVSALGGMPTFDTAEGATLHYEDTTPSDISTVGTPNVVSAPVKNLFQVDEIGLRMILKATWGMRNPKHVAMVSGTTW